MLPTTYTCWQTKWWRCATNVNIFNQVQCVSFRFVLSLQFAIFSSHFFVLEYFHIFFQKENYRFRDNNRIKKWVRLRRYTYLIIIIVACQCETHSNYPFPYLDSAGVIVMYGHYFLSQLYPKNILLTHPQYERILCILIFNLPFLAY